MLHQLHPYSWSFIPAYVLSPVLILIFTFWWFIPRYPHVSLYFPMNRHHFSGSKTPVFMVIYPDLFPNKSWMEPRWNHHQLWPQAILRWHQTAHWSSARLRVLLIKHQGTTKIVYFTSMKINFLVLQWVLSQNDVSILRIHSGWHCTIHLWDFGTKTGRQMSAEIAPMGWCVGAGVLQKLGPKTDWISIYIYIHTYEI